MVLIAVLFLGLGLVLGGGSTNESNHVGHHHESSIGEVENKEMWTCSMHPQIKLPGPGKCPICGMDLIPLESRSGSDGVDGPNIQLSPYAKKLAKVQTVKVSTERVVGTKEITGTIAWNETLLKTESAWFSGRIEKLNISFTGQYVKKGQVIAEIYSPELYSAAEEWKQVNATGNELLIQAVQKKLELLGLDDRAIKKLSEVNSERVVQRAKHSGVVLHRNVEEGQYIKVGSPLIKLGSKKDLWVELELFEQDLSLISVGQIISMKTESLPGKEFRAKVQFIDPVLNPQTRTVRIRLNIRNVKRQLKPGMLVRGKVSVKSSVKVLSIPETAPLLTGRRAVVYVEETEGVFTNRTVELGHLRNGFYEVLSGLLGSEMIVKRGAFKLDAAMQIQAHPSMMYPQGAVNVGMHNHGGSQEEAVKNKTLEEQVELSDADKNWVKNNYKVYQALQIALANDESKEAALSLNSLSKNLKKTPRTLDKGHSEHLANRFAKVAHSKSLEKIRNEMVKVSELMIDWLKKNNLKPKEGAAIYFCPMANNNQGAEWLQTGGSVSNPFYGSAMLRCGEKREVLSEGVI